MERAKGSHWQDLSEVAAALAANYTKVLAHQGRVTGDVIGGGWLMTTDRVGTGKFLIGIGAGMGLFSLIIQIAQNIYTLGAGAALDLFMATAMTTVGAGILLSIAARQMAKKPE